jgi:hypothetical protein
MDPDSLREFARRDRRPLADLKAQYWQERKALLGVEEVLRIADDLRERYRLIRPDWPDQAERDADLAVHVRVGEALRSVRRPR